MNMLRPAFAASLLCLGLLAACASPDRSISDDPESFNKLTAEQQAQVRKGDISVGMPDFGVQLALGRPDSITERTEAKGVVQIWHYKQQQTTVTGIDYVGFYNPYYFPGFAPVVVNNVEPAGDRVRVFFDHQKVVAIEKEIKR